LYVRLYLTHWPGSEFTYPTAFIPTTRPGAAVPNPLTPGTYLIGEVKRTNLAAGADDIVNVPWPANLIPPQTVLVSGSPVEWHPCLLIEVSPHDGPTPSGAYVWDNNNIAQKNISIVYSDADADFEVAAVIGSAHSKRRRLTLEIDRRGVPPQVRLWVRLLNRRLEEHLLYAGAEPVDPACQEVVLTLLEDTTAQAEFADPRCARESRLVTLPAKSKLRSAGLPVVDRGNFTVGHHGGARVFALSPHGTTRIPGIPSEFEPLLIVIGGYVPQGVAPGAYTIEVNQREEDARVTGSLGIELHVRAEAVRESESSGRRPSRRSPGPSVRVR
jgi:hypothetical protein